HPGVVAVSAIELERAESIEKARASRGTPGRRAPSLRSFYVLAAVLLCAFALGPLLHPEYFWGAHDARHSVYFLVEFERSIADGIVYPRWAPDFAFGYGYPIFNIYGPLSFYLAEGFRLVGFDYVAA